MVRVPVEGLPAGIWHGELQLGDWALPLPTIPSNLNAVKWRRRALPWYAKPAADGENGFALHVARTDLVKAMTRRIKP
ncbi:hypothetical protein AB0C98_11000 [Streptomyces sp. NPDC048558]|uniref:hypothetical protein n=1 Tax=Streptomyces sp. NPDC048558 TaxID=3155759 RepID=UPI0033DE1B47